MKGELVTAINGSDGTSVESMRSALHKELAFLAEMQIVDYVLSEMDDSDELVWHSAFIFSLGVLQAVADYFDAVIDCGNFKLAAVMYSVALQQLDFIAEMKQFKAEGAAPYSAVEQASLATLMADLNAVQAALPSALLEREESSSAKFLQDLLWICSFNSYAANKLLSEFYSDERIGLIIEDLIGQIMESHGCDRRRAELTVSSMWGDTREIQRAYLIHDSRMRQRIDSPSVRQGALLAARQGIVMLSCFIGLTELK